MADDPSLIPFRFELKWLIGPLAIILLAAGVALFFPAPETTPEDSTFFTPAQPVVVENPIDVAAARELALSQCEATFDCTERDCLEKVLTHIDSAQVSIDAVLRTPSPRVLRDHLRLAIERGVIVRLVLDSSLNPKFYLKGADIRVKKISAFVATNFMAIDRRSVVVGSNPSIYAAAPDIIKVACTENEMAPYLALFDRVWKTETNAFEPETTEEEILTEEELTVENSNTCNDTDCPPDTFFCEGTTKVWQNYFCSDACVYEILLLYFSTDCGYSNPGFGPDGSPLVVISETEVDEGQTSNEFLEFTAIQPLELSHFSLLRNGEVLVTFPEPYILNGSAKVFTGDGEDTTISVYLDLSSAIWKVPGTTATLINPNGDVVASQTFEG